MWNGWTVANEEEEGGWLNRNEEGWLISSCYTLYYEKEPMLFWLFVYLPLLLSVPPETQKGKKA